MLPYLETEDLNLEDIDHVVIILANNGYGEFDSKIEVDYLARKMGKPISTGRGFVLDPDVLKEVTVYDMLNALHKS